MVLESVRKDYNVAKIICPAIEALANVPTTKQSVLDGEGIAICAQNVYKIREIVKILKCQIAVVALHPVKSRKKERKMKRGMFSTSF